MPSLLPSCVIPETMKTSFIVIDSYEDGEIKGVFANFSANKSVVFDSVKEFLFEVDSMLETYLNSVANGVLDKFSFNTIESITDGLKKFRGEQTESLSSFFIKIWFVRNAQWKGSVEWIDGGITSDFKSVAELMSFMTEILDKTICKVSEIEKIGYK